MTGTSQACAACKYQRRKCTKECPLAPYFPHYRPKQFQSAHRLFGVGNILRTLQALAPNQKRDGMRSIVYHAEIRDKDPVHGCLGIIFGLRFQIQEIQQELDEAKALLAVCRQQQQHHQIAAAPPHTPSSQLQLAAPASANNSLARFHNHHQNQQLNTVNAVAAHHHLMNNATTESSSSSHDNTNDNIEQLWPPQYYPHPYNDNSAGVLCSQFIASQPLTCHEQQQQATAAAHGFDDMSTFLDCIDDRQSYVESKESR